MAFRMKAINFQSPSANEKIVLINLRSTAQFSLPIVNLGEIFPPQAD
jgi:hypothetical protein